MFIWNNMFFSLGFDVKDHYKEFGGDYAAYVAPVSKKYISSLRHEKKYIESNNNVYVFR